ncbi:hypothetical protein MBLNU13_g07149t1 [Cladosporium sp. NU13]
MHFSARSVLLASCLVISVPALPVTYSVVDVDGGSAANGAPGPDDQPATVYHTVTKSQDVEEPEPTTVSVSVTIVETQQASATSTNASSSSSSLSSSASSSTVSAQASSLPSSPAATPTDTQDALSVLESAKSTFLTRHTSIVSTPSGKPAITQAPSASPSSQASPSSSSEECEASSVTVTTEVTDAEETVTATQVSSELSTVVLFSTTTVTPAAAPTSYYDDGMWHTRYAIKPAASPEPVAPATKDDDAPPMSDKPSKPVDDKPAHAEPNTATNASSQAGNANHHARREIDPVAPTSTVPAIAADSIPEVSGTPLMLVQPLRQEASSSATPSDASTADAAVSPDVLSTGDDTATEKTAKREATYTVVSWNETTEG